MLEETTIDTPYGRFVVTPHRMAGSDTVLTAHADNEDRAFTVNGVRYHGRLSVSRTARWDGTVHTWLVAGGVYREDGGHRYGVSDSAHSKLSDVFIPIAAEVPDLTDDERLADVARHSASRVHYEMYGVGNIVDNPLPEKDLGRKATAAEARQAALAVLDAVQAWVDEKRAEVTR